MPDVVRALVGHEEPEGCRHQLADLVERARTGRAEERLQFGEGQFDRIEIRTRGREESQVRARVLDSTASPS